LVHAASTCVALYGLVQEVWCPRWQLKRLCYLRKLLLPQRHRLRHDWYAGRHRYVVVAVNDLSLTVKNRGMLVGGLHSVDSIS
jgi:hypothetical protein